MKFDFRRLSPALVTSLALLFLALLCASVGWVVFAWVLGLIGLALNVVAVAVVQIDDAPSTRHTPVSRTRRPGVSGERSSTRVSDSTRMSDKAKDARAALRDSASRSGQGSTAVRGTEVTSGQEPKITKR